jgi:hypothetical protein
VSTGAILAIIIIGIAATGAVLMRFRKRWLAKINEGFRGPAHLHTGKVAAPLVTRHLKTRGQGMAAGLFQFCLTSE